MSTIVVNGTSITLPASGGSPNWAPAIIEAFEALADAVNAVTGTYDVAPQVQNIDADNASTNVVLNDLSFPPADVRSAVIYYAVYRNMTVSDVTEVTDAGTLEVNYDDSRATNSYWEVIRSGGSTDASITFNMTDVGQVRFTTTSLGGGTHTGIVSYRAIALQNA